MASDLTADRFAMLKDAFARLCDCDEGARAQALSAMASSDPLLAAELEALLANLDESDLRAPAAREPSDLQFGPFRVLRKIGSGGMGEVFEAERVEAGFHQRVALKRVRHAGMSPELLRRFIRERQLLARLNHPGIARLIDGGVDADGRPWLAMEHVDGLSLLRHAQSHGLDLRARVELIRRVCVAVAFAHRNLIVHRDLKPANVLVTAEGEPKLLDFGIAKLLDDSEVEHTRLGMRALTLRYAAPEQVSGDRTTTATDVYALGVLLFEIASGHSPYAGTEDGTRELGQAVLCDPPRALMPLLLDAGPRDPSLPRRRALLELERIIARALAKAPLDRYESVAALDGDLDDWLHARPLRSGIGSARAQMAWLVRRYRWPLALVGGVLLALGVGAIAAWQQAQRAERQAAVAQANLDALLDVLGSANPERFAGRDPTASEFLVAAAKRVQEHHGHDPSLGRRALTEIGHGLLNLGRFEDAERVLSRAWSIAETDPTSSDSGRMAILGLLIQSLDDPSQVARARQTAAHVETLVRTGRVGGAAAIDALARAGATLARMGDFARAQALFERAGAQVVGGEPLHVIENYWRQRGWAHLRAAEPERAAGFLRQAKAVSDANPDGFVALRRAEGELLLAEAALELRDGVVARAHLEAARGVYLDEYPREHREHIALELLDAKVMEAEGRHADAAALLADVEARLAQMDGPSARDLASAALLAARLATTDSDCSGAEDAIARAHAQMATLPIVLPRERAALQQVVREVDAACHDAAGD